MSLFSLKNKTSLSFVFDIRDSSVSLAVARFSPEAKPELLVCKTTKIENFDSKDHEKYLKSMLKTIDKSILDAIKELRKIGNTDRVEKYLFFIGSPWSISTSKMIKVIKDSPFIINDEFLQKIVISQGVKAGIEIEKIKNEKGWVILEERVIQSKLNGYKINDIFNKKTNDLELELFVSFIPKEIKNKISSFVDQKFGKNTLRHSNSTILSSYIFLKDLYRDKNNFIYIDIGKLITDVYVVRDDVVYGIISFPFGTKSIVDIILSKTKMSENILLSSLNIKHGGNEDMIKQKDLDIIVDHGVKVWLDKLADAVGKICTEINIPNTIFMIPNDNLTNFIIKEITNIKPGEPLKLLGTEMNIEVINESAMNTLITNGKSFVNEPYIKMDLVFVDNMTK